MEVSPLRVGVLGTGNMAASFAASLADTDRAELIAVASRCEEKAAAFAGQHGVNNSYANYTDLCADAAVELVYVSTPHARHKADSVMCITAGKAVLCEKPFTINATEARNVIDLARKHKVFLMEAMWTRFLPSFVTLRKLLAKKTIGDVQLVLAGGAFQPDLDSDHYLLRPELGGGVLLDAGIYPVSAAAMMLGTPTSIKACGSIGQHGVDDQDAVLLQYGSGAVAMLYVSLKASASPDIQILGDRGRVHVHPPMFAPQKIDIEIYGENVKTIDLPFAGNGYHYQVEAAADAIRRGRTESEVMPLDETLSIMQTMDAIREQVGMYYPTEDTECQLS